MSKPSSTTNGETGVPSTSSGQALASPPEISGQAQKSSSEQPGAPPIPEFSAAQRRILLSIAHEAILSTLERRPVKDETPADVALSEPRGVFTTLYLRAQQPAGVEPQLRGCVGYALPVAPLYHAVAQTARAAAFEDSRFPPVTLDEALRLEVSLSVLSRLFPILPEAVEIGRHGLLITARGRRGLLLPQVPSEHGWNSETFLEQTCRKAGLPLDSWRTGATIEAFTAEVFTDSDIAESGVLPIH